MDNNNNALNFNPPQKPAEFTENRLIEAILAGQFPIDSNLPAERDLAALLGVTRPTLREALQRLARDGWIEIRHGKPTRVRDYWHEGNLGVLGAIARHTETLPEDFVPNLLAVRLLLAPAYTALAVERAPEQVSRIVNGYAQIADTPQAFAIFDWQLHHQLTRLSGNPVFTLILNGFQSLYLPMAERYFQPPETRAHSRQFYIELLDATLLHDSDAVEMLTRKVMSDSLRLWQVTATGQGKSPSHAK